VFDCGAPVGCRIALETRAEEIGQLILSYLGKLPRQGSKK